MRLAREQRVWEHFARTDALWAVLTHPEKAGHAWLVEEFFQTGRDEIRQVMEYVRTLPVTLATNRALDFGCGVGRLTQALGPSFDEVCGVDIAPAMIELAAAYAAHSERCRFLVNAEDSLPFSDRSFDFIYSNITLQHIPPKHTRVFLKEFIRVLRPGGLLIFQLPDRPRRFSPLYSLPFRLYYRLIRPLIHGGGPFMEMYCIRRRRVIRLLERAGARIVDIAPYNAAGREWTSYRYAATRS
jgi:SAM-dependent methyltransferase